MKDNMMTFSVVSNGGQYGGNMNMSIAIHQDSTLEQLLEVFERMCLALTYSPASFKIAYENRLEEMNDTLRTLVTQTEEDGADDFDEVLEEFANNKQGDTWASWTYKNAVPKHPYIRSKTNASE